MRTIALFSSALLCVLCAAVAAASVALGYRKINTRKCRRIITQLLLALTIPCARPRSRYSQLSGSTQQTADCLSATTNEFFKHHFQLNAIAINVSFFFFTERTPRR